MTQLLGPSVGYVDLLNYETTEQLKRDNEAGHHFKKTPLRPSAAGNCTRELFYSLMQYSGKAKYDVEVNKPETHRIFSLGHSVEYSIIRQFKEHLKLVEVRYQQQVLDFGLLESDDPALQQRLEGSIDSCFISDEWKCIVDFKSKKDKFSSFRSSAWDEMSERLAKMKSVHVLSESAYYVDDLKSFLAELGDAFFAANFLQLNLYASSEFIKQRGIDHAAIIQYSKNDSRLREVRFRPDPELAKSVVDKFQRVVRAVEKGDKLMAPKDHVLGSMKCAFCPYAKECWDENSLKAWFKTMPKKKWPTDLHHLGALGKTLENMFIDFSAYESQQSEQKRIEDAILKLMVEKELTKVKLANGDVYEAKHLKSPYPHFELRRSKA